MKGNIFSLIILTGLFVSRPALAATSAGCFKFHQGIIQQYNCRYSNVEVPDMIDGQAVTAIGDAAFMNAGLTRIVFPETLVKIGNEAFRGNHLSEVTFPASTEEIGQAAFMENRLVRIALPKFLTIVDRWAFAVNSIESVVIPELVSEIRFAAFYSNGKLQTLVMPHSVRKIGKSAFRYSDLRSIEIGSDVEFDYETFGNLFWDDYRYYGRKAGLYKSPSGKYHWHLEQSR